MHRQFPPRFFANCNAYQGGTFAFYTSMDYIKQPLDFPRLLQMLKDRGLIIPLALFLSAFFFVELFHVLSSLLCYSLAISLFLLRLFLATSSLSVGFASEGKAKFYRSQSEDLSKTYRTSIEDLSNIYRRPIEDLSKKGWRGSGESRGRFWLQSYKIPKPHFHLFGR